MLLFAFLSRVSAAALGSAPAIADWIARESDFSVKIAAKDLPIGFFV
jgi:hypothetical protein